MTERQPQCRFCAQPLRHTFVDLGMSPLCQTHISAAQLNQMEPFYPLHAYVCERCFLVQLEEFVAPADIFSEYAYFSSYADSWVEHARRYCEDDVRALRLGRESRVVEIASNDGYLLQHFVARGVRVLGHRAGRTTWPPRRIRRGVPTLVKFFGSQTARELRGEFRGGGPAGRQQRARARSGPERLRRRDEAAARRAGRDHDGVPAPAGAHAAQSVRHHLPRALQLLLVHDRARASSRRTG